MSRDRVGTLDGKALRLARWVEVPYTRTYQPIWPQRQDVSGAPEKVEADSMVRRWYIDRWDGGEGEDLWDAGTGKYSKSTACRPKLVGDGFVLGHPEVVTTLTGAGAFTESRKFGLAEGALWTARDGTLHKWDDSTQVWGAGIPIATDPYTKEITSMADPGDGYIYTAHAYGAGPPHTGSIRQIDTSVPSNATHYAYNAADPFTEYPVIRSVDNVLYALDANDLYTIDLGSTDTRTLIGDVGGTSTYYFANAPMCWQRMTVSDKGPLWFQHTDNGQTFIWEYNIGTATASRVGKLPVDFAFPTSIFWTAGFTFVGFRAGRNTTEGDGYIYYQRGAQRGILGPIRATTTALQEVLLAGAIGEELIIYFNGNIYAYNFGSGGIFHIASGGGDTPGSVTDAITFGKDIFLANYDDDKKASRIDTKTYAASGSLESGRHDFDYFGVGKILLDVTVVTDPLPSNTVMEVFIRVEGIGEYSLGTTSVDGDTNHHFTASTSTTTYSGRDFEIIVELRTAVPANTPTVRSISARATSAEKVKVWNLKVDVGSPKAGLEGASYPGSVTLADLASIAETNKIVSFVDPWQSDEWDTVTGIDVVVEDVVVPDVGREGPSFATVQLRARTHDGPPDAPTPPGG